MSRRMPRPAAALAALLLAGAGLVLAAAPAVAAAGSPAARTGQHVEAAPAAKPAAVSVVPAGTDDFVFDSFDAVYELGTDADGRSVLDTTETLVAVFPDFDQNRGIRRAIPLSYDGHPVDLEVRSVTDETGAPREYSTEPDDDDEFLLVSIAGDDYVHGRQSYVIEYRQHNVTHVPDDRPIDEFYWDVNGTGWAQPFARVSAEVRLTGAAAEGFADEGACYQGPSGSNTPCTSLELGTSGATATAEAVGPYENLTVALAFEPGTFVPRDDAFTSSPAALAGAGGALLAIGAAGAAIGARATRWRDHPGRGTIIAQYEPPPGLSVMEAAELAGQPGKGVTATILQLAVLHRLRVVELGPKRFAVEYGGGEGPDPDADQLLRELFATSGRRELKQQDTALGKKLLALRTAVRGRVVTEGLRRTPPAGPRVLLGLVALLGGIAAVVFGIIALDQAMGGGWPVLGLVLGILAVLTAAFAVIDVRPLTERGRAAKDHLAGLKVYLELAEADRIRMLQSPDGALRAGGPDAVLKLHEKLLPYAVIFGIEREWSRVLAAEYAERNAQPEWYAGRGPFDAIAFSAGVSAFSTTSSSSWSGSSSSSSSSGSGGGGSSGGGGGGGGGGGL